MAGSIYQRASDGRWCVALSAGGKRIVRYASNEREAKRILAGLQRDLTLERLAAPSRLTLAEWVDHWLATAEYRPSTVATYRQVLAPVLARIGHQRLSKLTPVLLHGVFATLAQGMGDRRRQMAYLALARCLRQAVRLGVLGSNPLDRVAKPAWTPRERRYWSPDETARFLATCLAEPRRWSPLFVVLATGGLRIGEALGVQWQDVDLAAKTLRIERAYVWDRTGCHLVPPKTKAGYRTVTLPEQAVTAIRSLPRKLDPQAFLFHDGRPPDPTTIRQALQRECRRAGTWRPR
jgi:integrase